MDVRFGIEHQAVDLAAARRDRPLDRRPESAAGKHQQRKPHQRGRGAQRALLVALVPLVAAGIALGGCGSARPAASAPTASNPSTRSFLVKEAQLQDGVVSVHLQIPLDRDGPRPVIIGSLGDPHPMLHAGFAVATYTIHWNKRPGASPPASPTPAVTVGKWVLASPSAGVLGQSYLRGIAATAVDYVPIIIDWLETVPEVDASRIGISGVSTNGFVALQAVAADRRIRAAAVVAACGDYRIFLRDSSMGMQGAPLQLDPEYERWVERQEIIHDPQRMLHAAVLMVNYDGDELIPIACADRTAEVLAKAYAAAGVPDRFRYSRLAQTGHGLSPKDAAESIAWLARWLSEPGAQ